MMINALKNLIKYLEDLGYNTTAIGNNLKNIGKLLSKIFLLSYISEMKYISPFWKIIRLMTKWSIYTTILTSFSSFILSLMSFDFELIYLINTIIGFITGAYILLTEIDYDMWNDILFTIINSYNKILAKIILKLENLPNKSQKVLDKINKIKNMFIKIPSDKINHEVLSEIPKEVKDKIKDSLAKNQDKQPIDYYYIELEKMMDPEYRRRKFREYLKEEMETKYRHLLPKDKLHFEKASFNFYDYLTFQNLTILSFMILAPTLNYFFPWRI
uniref:hypothetical protein n=1 Tax=Inonotus hispidus TaxID=40469 RepID=UPI0021822529|nr:hypothetical protein N4M07_mgp009 [Inonotus hispidus]UVF37947.1 hypothetical protein [Inonotus hispidus]